MTLLYLIPALYRPAGMERVLTKKANWLVAHGYEVMIVTTDQKGRPNAFGLDERIKVKDLDINYEENNGGSFLNKLINYPFKQSKHRRALTELLSEVRPDVTVSMFCNDEGFLPKIQDGSRKVLEIHFSKFKRIQYGRKGIWALADKIRTIKDALSIRRFDKFVVLTNEDAGYWGRLRNIEVIPNPRTFVTDEPSTLNGHLVIAAGRFNAQKNFEGLLDAWSMVPRLDDWKLWIVGDGEERQNLEIRTLGIEDRVILGSPEDDMQAAYRKASIYAMTSRYEGLPMVLLEAQAMGLPIVSYTCKCGPKDVVTEGVDGFLVPMNDKLAFASRLDTLMRDEALRRKMGAAAYEASDRFDEDAMMAKWDKLFKSIRDGK